MKIKILTKREQVIIEALKKYKFVNRVSQRLKITKTYVYQVKNKHEEIVKNSKKEVPQEIGGGSPPFLWKKEELYECLRLHSIELRLLTSGFYIRTLLKRIKKDKEKYKFKIGSNKGIFFSFSNITGMIIHSKDLYIFYPEDFDVTAKTLASIYTEFESILIKDMERWEKHFHITIIKDGRAWYEWVNRHLSIVNDFLSKDFKKYGIMEDIKAYDNEGKVAYMFDASKGQSEWESPNPDDCNRYILNALYLIKQTKDGEFKILFNDTKTLKKEINLLSKAVYEYILLAEKRHILEHPVMSSSEVSTSVIDDGIPEYIG